MPKKIIFIIHIWGAQHYMETRFFMYNNFFIKQIQKKNMDTNQQVERTIGFKLCYSDTSVAGLLAQKQNILDNVQIHGAVCIKNVDFDEKDMVEFSKGMYDEVVVLPTFLCFNNVPKEYPEITRVGNILLDGSLKDSQKQSAYWHQDGDFLGVQNRHIFNNLLSKVVPEVGGETHIMDMVVAAQFLKNNKPELYQRLFDLVGALDIEKIADFARYDAKNVLNVDSITYHEMISKDEKTGKERVYTPTMYFIDKKTGQVPTDITPKQVLGILENEMGYYSHKWEKGDLLVWDNLSVAHRASGSFQGRRLMFRTYGRFKKGQ